MQSEGQNKTLSVIIVLSVVVGALASAAAILYHFRDRLSLDRFWSKRIGDSSRWKGCCCFSDEQCEDEEAAETVPAEEKPADEQPMA